MESDNEHQPLVSIIISVFNDNQTINDCIASALAQSYKNIEIIVIDDHSEKLKYTLNLVWLQCMMYRNARNMGVAYCRNKGVKLSSGE